MAEVASGTKAPFTSPLSWGEAQPPASSAAVASVTTRASSREGLQAGLWRQQGRA